MFNRNRSHFELDEVGYKELISWEGDVGDDFNERIKMLVYRARAAAPVRTGNLKRSIDVKYDRPDAQGLSAEIGSNLGYALAQHDGTGVYAGHSPYKIKSKHKGSPLRFGVGKLVRIFRYSAVHPGIKGHYYLSLWLKEFVA